MDKNNTNAIITCLNSLKEIENNITNNLKETGTISFNQHGFMVTSYALNSRISCLENEINKLNNTNINSKSTYKDHNKIDYDIMIFILRYFDKNMIRKNSLLYAYSSIDLIKHFKDDLKKERKLLEKYNII